MAIHSQFDWAQSRAEGGVDQGGAQFPAHGKPSPFEHSVLRMEHSVDKIESFSYDWDALKTLCSKTPRSNQPLAVVGL